MSTTNTMHVTPASSSASSSSSSASNTSSKKRFMFRKPAAAAGQQIQQLSEQQHQQSSDNRSDFDYHNGRSTSVGQQQTRHQNNNMGAVRNFPTNDLNRAPLSLSSTNSSDATFDAEMDRKVNMTKSSRGPNTDVRLHSGIYNTVKGRSSSTMSGSVDASRLKNGSTSDSYRSASSNAIRNVGNSRITFVHNRNDVTSTAAAIDMTNDNDSNSNQPSDLSNLTASNRNQSPHPRSMHPESENAGPAQSQPEPTDTETPVRANKMSFKTRARSISPHARQILARTFSRSTSRSRSNSRAGVLEDDSDLFSIGSTGSSSTLSDTRSKPMLVAVTSCRSDAYHSQKAPGATSKLPRKAPSALKLFHELAVGVKDAYEAVGATPTKPEPESTNSENVATSSEGDQPLASGLGTGGGVSIEEREGRATLWEFMGHLDFLLALVDEVATDTATRGALKDDNTFKSLRDVIKKCNKVLESMLVRRERKYTLFFRLVLPHETKEIKKMRSWNVKVEKAVGAVADGQARSELTSETTSDAGSDGGGSMSGVLASNETSSGSRGLFGGRRGRSMLPSAGKVRGRRATPTPRLRARFRSGSDASAVSGEDGYSTITEPITPGNLERLQNSLTDNSMVSIGMPVVHQKSVQKQIQPLMPKDELVDVIRGLRSEKMVKENEAANENQPMDLKPNWMPKADIPSAVPKLPAEYIHRHRLMKQVVNCLLDKPGAGPKDTDDEIAGNSFITSITSRHADKAGNGKTTLAVAAIQSVEVRERFSDGIGWIQLGRTPPTEKDIRRLYEELHSQLLMNELESEEDREDGVDSYDTNPSSEGRRIISRSSSLANMEKDETDKGRQSARNSLVAVQLAKSRRRFQGGELEGMKEDIGRILSKRKVLICLDDVWRPDDAKWFIFDTKREEGKKRDSVNTDNEANYVQDDGCCSYRLLMTTRTPSLLGYGNAQEVFVRIFSEHEAVKLLLSSAGRRVYGGKNSPVFNQARVIVKGCGNSPLALRLAGGMLRSRNRNWTLSTPTWTSLVEQCRASLEEASKIRSFVNSVGRIVDLSFVTISDLVVRTATRRCFVTFAMVFHDNDWVLTGKGVPRGVVTNLFSIVISASNSRDAIDSANNPDFAKAVSPEFILSMLENMNLLQRARHGAKPPSLPNISQATANKTKSLANGPTSTENEVQENPADRSACATEDDVGSAESPSYLMHESIKYIAEEMATRITPSFAPNADEYTSFGAELEEELCRKATGSRWLKNAVKYLFSPRMDYKENCMSEHQFHELIVSSLTGVGASAGVLPITEVLSDNKDTILLQPGGTRVEKYIAAYLPTHLIRAKMLTSASALLCDKDFIRRRVAALGAIESTRRQVADLVDLRREILRISSSTGCGVKDIDTSSPKRTSSQRQVSLSLSPHKSFERQTNAVEDENNKLSNDDLEIDINAIQTDASKQVIDEVYRLMDVSMDSSDSLNMAICLSTVGEGLLKARQPREALLRLEEAVGIYRGLLGPYHIDVARALHSVAKALSKSGETRGALLKFGEASRIYEACNATRHYDSIANIQCIASLLVDVGEKAKAESKYEEIIALRKSVCGFSSVQVAKAINDYAVVLAKHGRMNDALRQYEDARTIYELLATSEEERQNTLADSFESCPSSVKYDFDITLIDLNIASIKSKKGDLKGAIASYEKGVVGLRRHLEQQEHQGEIEIGDSLKVTAQKRHLVSAYGRIGSLKMKTGDSEGALDAYLTLICDVDAESPISSRTEKAKAHVKCATIYRQGTSEADGANAITHLTEALRMYTDLHGLNHRDTQAIASSLRQWQAQDIGNVSSRSVS